MVLKRGKNAALQAAIRRRRPSGIGSTCEIGKMW
jgi:hypothetical protein